MASEILLLVSAPYAAVAVGYLEARKRGERPPRWARWAGLATVAIHLAALVLLSAETRRSPFQSGSQALSFLAFSLAGLYAVLETSSKVATYGGRFYLLTALLAAASVPGLSGASAAATVARTPDPILTYHVGFALLGTAAITAGGLLAAGYLGVYRHMKAHRLGPERGDAPSLTGLQVLSRHASVAGLLLLGPSLVLGAMVLSRGSGNGGAVGGAGAFGTIQIGVSALQFAIVLAAAFLWWRRPLRGATAAWLNVAAMCVAVLSLAVVHPLLVQKISGG